MADVSQSTPTTIAVLDVLPVVISDYNTIATASVKDKALIQVLHRANTSPVNKYIIAEPAQHDAKLLSANVLMRQGRILGVPESIDNRGGVFEGRSKTMSPDYQANSVVIASGGVSMEYGDIGNVTHLGKKISAMLNLLIDQRIGMVVGIGNKRESGINVNGEHPPWENNPLTNLLIGGNNVNVEASFTDTWLGHRVGRSVDINTRYLPAFRNYILEVDWMGRVRELIPDRLGNLQPLPTEEDTTLYNHGDFGEGFEKAMNGKPYVLRVTYEQPLDTLFDPLLSDVVVWQPFLRFVRTLRDQPTIWT